MATKRTPARKKARKRAIKKVAVKSYQKPPRNDGVGKYKMKYRGEGLWSSTTERGWEWRGRRLK